MNKSTPTAEQSAKPTPQTHKRNPAHTIGTCAKCGGEMTFNVPRIGPAGGYVHKTSQSLDCK